MNIFVAMGMWSIILLMFAWVIKFANLLGKDRTARKEYITKKRLLFDCLYLFIYFIVTYITISATYHFTVISNNTKYSEQGLIFLGFVYPVIVNAFIVDVTIKKCIIVISDVISINKQKKDTLVNRFFKTLDNGTDEEIRNQYYSLKYTPIVKCSLSNEQTFRVIYALIKCEEYKEAESLSRQLGGIKPKNTHKAVLKSVE